MDGTRATTTCIFVPKDVPHEPGEMRTIKIPEGRLMKIAGGMFQSPWVISHGCCGYKLVFDSSLRNMAEEYNLVASLACGVGVWGDCVVFRPLNRKATVMCDVTEREWVEHLCRRCEFGFG